MSAYDRTKGAFYGVDLGKELTKVDMAVRDLCGQPGPTEVETSIGNRAYEVVRTLRGALRAAEMLHHICQRDDDRPVKRLDKPT